MACEVPFTFPGADGTLLSGILAKPAETCPSDRRHLCVVMIHGGMAHKNAFYHKLVGQRLVVEFGVCVFRYDRNNNGQSHGTRNFMGGFHQDVDDVGAVMELLKTEHHLTPFCVIGHSAGAQLMFDYVAGCSGSEVIGPGYHRDNSPLLLINVHSRFDLAYWREEYERQVAGEAGAWVLQWRGYGRAFEHRVSKEDVDTYSTVDMGGIVSRLNSSPVQVLSVYGIVPQDNLAQTTMG